MWDKILNNKVYYGKVSKNEYTSLIKEYSFNVPSLDDRLGILKKIFFDETSLMEDSKAWLNRKQYILGIVISTLKVSEIEKSKDVISHSINTLYSYVVEHNLVIKFLDFILANDWGKTLEFLCHKTDLKLWNKILLSDYLKKSDEFGSLLLKIMSSNKGKELLYQLNYDVTSSRFIELCLLIKGKTGGLLRNTYFAVRREPILIPAHSAHENENYIIDFLQLENFNDINSYALIMIAIRSLNIDLAYIVKTLKYTKPHLSYMLATSFNYPFLIWSNIQIKLLTNGLLPYNSKAILKNSLYDFYDNLLIEFPESYVSDEKVGVILTTYNPDIKLLFNSISSILKQSYSNLELCIVDDCSSELNREKIKHLIDELDDSRIHLILNEKNIGQYLSRNVAMNFMKDCTFYAIQDDDDVSHSQRIESQVKNLKETQAKLNMCEQVRFTSDMKYAPDKIDPNIFDFSPASSLFYKSLIDEIGGFANVRTRGDVEFITRIKNKYTEAGICNLSLPLYIMRCDLGTVSSTKDKFLKTQLDVFRKIMSAGEINNYIEGQQYALNSN